VISGILLAAGKSRRFGSGQKLLQPVSDGGLPVVCQSARALAVHAEELVVVIDRYWGDSDVARVLGLLSVQPRFVVARGGGMADSLASGVSALDPSSEAALVGLGDEPFVEPEAIAQIVARYRAGGVQIVVPRYRGTRGHPVLFSSLVYSELMALSGDHGARAVADRDPARRAFVDLDLPKPVDVDTPDDLARLRP
jgi:molybdenum cofactor cytidylyltransferase